MGDKIILMQPLPFGRRAFCVCAIGPSGRGCRARARARRRQRHRGSGERAPPGDDGGGEGPDGPPSRPSHDRAGAS